MELKEEVDKSNIETQTPLSLKFAPVWKRVVSYLIDEIFLLFIISVLSYLAYYKEISFIQQQSNFEQLLYDFAMRNQLQINVVSFILHIAYFALLWVSGGQTIGAKLTGIYVIHIENKRLNLILSTFRALLLWLTGFSFYIPLIFVINPVYRQRLHDFLSYSVVIEKPKIEKKNLDNF
ncbi:MAG: RDD family protein [Brevinematia bacterium]